MPSTEAQPAERERKARTAELLRRAAGAHGRELREIQDEVVCLNLPVARELARSFRGRDVDLEDLEQVACLALVRAVRAFRPGAGADLLSYVVPSVRGELRRYFRDHGWTVRPPRRVQELQAALPRAEEVLRQRLGQDPGPGELAGHLGVDPAAVVEARSARGCFVPASLDAPGGRESGATVGERLGGPDAELERAEARVMLAPAVRRLSRRERRILELRFLRGCTQAEIGADIGVTQMQVSRLLGGIYGKLRSQLAEAA